LDLSSGIKGMAILATNWRITSPRGSALQVEVIACHDHEGLKLALEWAVSLELARFDKWQMPLPSPFANGSKVTVYTHLQRDKRLHEPSPLCEIRECYCSP
jgi:hypothetical protein